jgi:predicted house-cleaning noncanonical NTP pyrophosphatase (MazG superfamily)
MNDIIKAVQKHEIEVASQSIDKLVEEIHRVLTDKDADLLESLEEHLSDIVSAVKDNLKEESKKAAKAATGKKVKDPNAPKRTPSEYNNFIKDNIASLREEHPAAKPKELMSMAVDAWRIHKEKIGATKPMGGAKLLSDTEDSDADIAGPSTKKVAGKKNGKK